MSGLRAVLRDSDGKTMDCKDGNQVERRLPPVDPAENLADAIATWFLTCVGPHVNRLYSDPADHPVVAEFQEAAGRGEEEAVFRKYLDAATNETEALIALLDSKPTGSILDAEVKAIVMRRAAGLVQFHQRDAEKWTTYENGGLALRALQDVVVGEFYSARDAVSIRDFVAHYPWADGRCHWAPLEASDLRQRIEQAIEDGETFDAGDVLNPLANLKRRDFALLNLSEARGWEEGLLAVGFLVGYRERIWESQGVDVSYGQARGIVSHGLAYNRTLLLEELHLSLEPVLDDEAVYARNRGAGAEFLALHGLPNPFLRIECSSAA